MSWSEPVSALIMLRSCPHAGWTSVELLVEEVALAAYGLRQRKVYAGKVAQNPHVDLSDPGKMKTDSTAYHRAVKATPPSQIYRMRTRLFLNSSNLKTT